MHSPLDRHWAESGLTFLQEKPTKEEMNQNQKAVTKERESIYGVRMGAGDRSYLVRDNKIGVFKNRYGGVEVSLSFANPSIILLTAAIQSL